MDGDGLVGQATALPPRARMTLGLALTWMLAPVLRFDDSQEGRQRAEVCRQWLDQALGDVAQGPSDALLEDVTSSDELQLDEEPDGPAGFRVDFLAALDYALRSGQGDERSFTGLFSRVESTLEFLADTGLATEPPGLNDQVLEVIDVLADATAYDQDLLTRLQDVLAPARDQLGSRAS